MKFALKCVLSQQFDRYFLPDMAVNFLCVDVLSSDHASRPLGLWCAIWYIT